MELDEIVKNYNEQIETLKSEIDKAKTEKAEELRALREKYEQDIEAIKQQNREDIRELIKAVSAAPSAKTPAPDTDAGDTEETREKTLFKKLSEKFKLKKE